jgi:hypothetical protein
MRLTRMDKRLRKVESKSRTAKVRIPKAKAAPEKEEELWVSDVFPPITERLEQWNIDRRQLLKAEESPSIPAA